MDGLVVLVVVAVCIVFWVYFKEKKNEEKGGQNATTSKAKEGDCIYNTKHEVVARFKDGKIYYGQVGGVIGYYDSNGDVFNSDKEKIGFMREEKMWMSREFIYNRFVKMMPHMQLKKPTIMYEFLGEVLGSNAGTIYEDSRCDNATAYFELENEKLCGAGAAYIVFVYEKLIPSGKSSYYKMDLKDWL